MTARPLHLPFDEAALFAVYHPPEDVPGTAGRPVLICSPWGWDDVASYRSRRQWASALAHRGHPTLRFDLPATGNSGGTPSDPDLVERWIRAVEIAAERLAELAPARNVTVLGLGLGGLLALEAARAGAPIDGAVLWGTPGGGRRFVRETRAFAAMQDWNSDEQADFNPGVPTGWVEAGGFALAPTTIEALGGLVPKGVPGLRRAMLLDRDGIAPDPKLAAALEAGGTGVSTGPGPGWGTLVSHPERSRLPAGVVATVLDWLADDDPGSPSGDRASELPPAAAPVAIDPGGVRETVVPIEAGWGMTVGILAEGPKEVAESPLCALFLNAGAVRTIGPSRLWTETARRWAVLGVPSMRVDLEGVGEADGVESGGMAVGDFYLPRYADQVSGVIDELEARGIARRFVLVGLCSGGYWAFHQAVADRRVAAAFSINAGALRWDPELLPMRAARTGGGRAREGRYWRRLLRGEIPIAKIARLAASVFQSVLLGARSLLERPFGRSLPQRLKAGIEADLDRLSGAGTGTLIAFSAGESLAAEVTGDGLVERAAGWPGLRFADLPGSDHTLRPAVAQREFASLVDAEVRRILAAQTNAARS